MPSSPGVSTRNTVLVLWGERYDEVAATVFTSTLRQRGLRVYLVGLDGPAAIGNTGIIINVDRTLGQAAPLAAQAACIVVPCDRVVYLRAENDPRFDAWMAEAARPPCRIVLQDGDVAKQTALSRIPVAPAQIVTYGGRRDLLHFADELASLLLAGAATGQDA